MKALHLLILTIVLPWGFVEAVPSPSILDKRIGNVGDPPLPILTIKKLLPQATYLQFYKADDISWKSDADVKKDASAQKILARMPQSGLFTAVVMTGAHSSVVVPESGLTTPSDWIKSNNVGPALITNGGFFIMGVDPDLVADFNNGQKGKPLPQAQYKGYSVGATSGTKNTVDYPSVHEGFYQRFTADDKTYLTSGPDLKKPVDTTVPPEAQANTNAGKLQYYVHDDEGQRIPTAPGRDDYVRTEFSHIPGGVVTSNEPNERAAVVIVDSCTKIAFAYTSHRQTGVTINDLRDLISIFLENYIKGKRIEDTQMALNLDGGGSIYIAWVANGKTEVIATGNLGQNPTQEQPDWTPRQVTTMVKYTWLA